MRSKKNKCQLALQSRGSYVCFCVRQSRRSTWETVMTWKTPKIVEVPVGMEINMYACAARK
jgi:coenzyme PQQ precursor peptide PqqA